MNGHAPQTRIAVLLAGGRSRRMGGCDKALVRLGGERLVDRVISRLKPQCDQVLIAAPHDFGTGLAHIPDAPDAPPGPVGGIYSAYKWLLSHEPAAAGFFTVPVDGPFLPDDLIARLGAGCGTAIATDGESDHPTFAFWSRDALGAAWPQLADRTNFSLKALARACAARRVVWADGQLFFNVNTRDDLLEAERRVEGG